MSIIDRVNRQIEKKIGETAREMGTTAYEKRDVFEKYEKLLQDKTVFSVQFQSCGRDGTFIGVDQESGVHFIMPGSTTLEHLSYFKPHMASLMVGYQFDVRVTQIDRERKRIYVESSHERRARSTQSQVVGALMKELNAGNKPRVWGRIISVQGQYANIDILGEHVLGRIKVTHWQKSYLRNLASVCSPDEYYAFHVVGALPKKTGKQQAFLLDRTELAEDPWENIPMDVLKVGTVIMVKCIELQNEKGLWWGCSAIAPGIEIMGKFPREKGKLYMFQDMTYMCKIIQIRRGSDQPAAPGEKNDNVFVVSPYAVAEQDANRYQKFLTFKATKAAKEQVPTNGMVDYELLGQSIQE